jgi:cell division protein FtsB
MNGLSFVLVLVVFALLCVIAYLAVDVNGRKNVIAAQYEYIAALKEYQDALTELVAELQKKETSE